MADKPTTAPAVFPNAGVEAWYRKQLQAAVREMSQSMLYHVRAAWKQADADEALAVDRSPMLAAGVMFRIPDGRILLLHRTDGAGWAFPAGGIENAETAEAAARREASEETGWAAGLPLEVYDVRQTAGVLFTTFVCDVPAPFRLFLNHEHDRAEWTDPEYAVGCHVLHPGVRATLTARSGLTTDRSPVLALQKALKKWGDLWTKKLDDMAARLAKQFAGKSQRATQAGMQASFKKAGWTVEFKPTEASVEAYRAVVAENVNLIKSIPAQYLKDLQTQVWQSVMVGGDMSTLTQHIQQEYGVAYRRAAFIARDQNNKAKAVMENVRRQELGVTEAVWMHSHGGKEPRPTHVALNGQKYKLDKGAYDKRARYVRGGGYEGEWVFPGQLPNCRCTSRAVIPGLGDPKVG